jgi:serine/threonine protein kinase
MFEPLARLEGLMVSRRRHASTGRTRGRADPDTHRIPLEYKVFASRWARGLLSFPPRCVALQLEAIEGRGAAAHTRSDLMAMPNLVPDPRHLGLGASAAHASLGGAPRAADPGGSKGERRQYDRARMNVALVSYEARGSARSVLPPPTLPPFDDFSHDEPSPALRAPSPPSIAVRPAHRSEELHPGDLVAGKYRVRAILGRNHGLVLDAFHTEFDQRVIIKLLPAGSGDDKEIERFRREARTLSKLESEHVARILDVGTEPDGSFYLVRQYLEGSDLSSYLRQHGALALPDAVLLILQVAEAAAETHGHGIVIRELSPEHVFLTARVGGAPVLKIVDFGTAKLMRDLTAPGAGGELTATAMFGLSPYSSPELVRKARSVDQRTDVWSLGAIFYELLTGRPPFAGDMAQLMLGITREEPVPVSTYRPDLPPELDQIVGWCLAKDVDGRFKNVHAFAHALSPYATAEAQILIERIGAIAQAARQRRGGSVPPPAPALRSAATAPGPGAPAPPPSAPMYSSGLEFGRTSAPPPAPASVPAGSLLGPSPTYSTPPPAPALSALAAGHAATQPLRGAEATPGSLRPAVAAGAGAKGGGLSPLARQAILWSLATIAVMLPAVVVVLVLRARAPEPAAGPITVESKTEPQKAEPASTATAAPAKEPEAPPRGHRRRDDRAHDRAHRLGGPHRERRRLGGAHGRAHRHRGGVAALEAHRGAQAHRRLQAHRDRDEQAASGPPPPRAARARSWPSRSATRAPSP